MIYQRLSKHSSGRGLNTSGRKVELVARAFAALKLKMNIIASSEELQKLINGPVIYERK